MFFALFKKVHPRKALAKLPIHKVWKYSFLEEKDFWVYFYQVKCTFMKSKILLKISQDRPKFYAYIGCQNHWTLKKTSFLTLLFFVTPSKPFLSSGCVGDLAQMGEIIFIISYITVTSVLPFITVICDPEEDEGMQVICHCGDTTDRQCTQRSIK